MNYINYIDTEMVTKVLPIVIDYFRAVSDLDIVVQNWLTGITELTHGYVSPFIVPEVEIRRVVRYLTNKVLQQPQFRNLKVPSVASSYYYKLQNIAYTHMYNNMSDTKQGSTLYISLMIPLLRVGGVMPVYRIDVYPVPVKAGIAPILQEDRTHKSTGFTMLHNMPDFIAVSENQETFVELNTNQYLTCKGYPEIKVCGSGTPALKHRRTKESSCAFALFIEDSTQVLKHCDLRYINTDQWLPDGSAIQLTADSSFLMHASYRRPEGDTWTMSCPLSHQTPQYPVKVCDMCRIYIPCFCSLSGADFYLPARYTGCFVSNPVEGATVSYKYHINTAMIQSLFSSSDEAKYMSFKNFTELQHPPFDLPDIRFSVEDNFTEYVDISDKYSAQLSATLDRQSKDLQSYSNNIDAALNRTRDFSDQVVDRAGSIENALRGFLDKLFGGKIGVALTVIFSPLTVVLLAFIIAAFDFVPGVTTAIYVWLRQKEASQMYRLLLVQTKEQRQQHKHKHTKRKKDGLTYVSLYSYE